MMAIKVGTDWNECPICHCSYVSGEEHHSACPQLIQAAALCRFCNAAHGRSHDLGCPSQTGLFPVLHREIMCGLACAYCETPFTSDDCYVCGRTGLVCIGCATHEELLA